MRRHAHWQHYRALRSFAFGDIDRAFYRSDVSRNYNLGWGIEIGRFDNLVRAAGFPAGRPHNLIVESEDGRHRTDACGYRLLHGLCAKTHERRRIGEIDRAGRNQSTVFAQTMSGGHLRPGSVPRAPRAIKRNARRQHFLPPAPAQRASIGLGRLRPTLARKYRARRVVGQRTSSCPPIASLGPGKRKRFSWHRAYQRSSAAPQVKPPPTASSSSV